MEPRAPTEEDKQYVKDKKVENLFQSLTIGLMYHQPDDPVDYLLQCLAKVKLIGYQQVTWDTFLPNDRPRSGRNFHKGMQLPPLPGVYSNL